MSDRLFDPGEALSPAPRPAGPPRLRLPRRDQVEVQAVSLDQVLDPDDEVGIAIEPHVPRHRRPPPIRPDDEARAHPLHPPAVGHDGVRPLHAE